MSDATPIEPRPPAAVRAVLADNRKRLCSFFVERDAEVTGLHCAAICRQHVLLVGPPGTAKSLLARAFSAQWCDGIYWEGLGTRQSTEGDIFCSLDIPAMIAGRRQYIFDGQAPPAHFAFLDEAFKLTGGMLNAGLGWLNERIVRGFKSPLVTCVAASNEFGEDDSVQALEDRFLFRYFVAYIDDRAAKLSFLRDRVAHRDPPKLAPVTLVELEACQAEAATLPVEDSVLDALATLQINLNGVGVQVSDRRLAATIAILQAYAWLEGDSQVGTEHLEILRNVLWRRPEDRPAVDAAIGAVPKGQIGEIRAIVERALVGFYAARKPCVDGAWLTERDRQAYLQQCPEFMQEARAAGAEIKKRFGGQVPQRVKERAASFLKELETAFLQCRGDLQALKPPTV